jgi:hypothetical protein
MSTDHVKISLYVGLSNPGKSEDLVQIPFSTIHVEDGQKHIWKVGRGLWEAKEPYPQFIKSVFLKVGGETEDLGLLLVARKNGDLVRASYLTELTYDHAYLEAIPNGMMEFVGGTFLKVVPYPIDDYLRNHSG